MPGDIVTSRCSFFSLLTLQFLARFHRIGIRSQPQYSYKEMDSGHSSRTWRIDKARNLRNHGSYLKQKPLETCALLNRSACSTNPYLSLSDGRDGHVAKRSPEKAIRDSGQVVLHCAYGTRTISSCAFCEQERQQTAPILTTFPQLPTPAWWRA